MPAGFDQLRQQFRGAGAVPAPCFPHWFAGVAFAAIAIGALVPAAIMSIACGNLFTRNIYQRIHRTRIARPRPKPGSPRSSPSLAKLGALFFVLALKSSYAIQLQLLGGIWICQTVPAVLVALSRAPASHGASDRLGVRASPPAPGWPGAWASKARSMCCTSSAWPCPAMRRLSALALNLAVGDRAEPDRSTRCRRGTRAPTKRVAAGLRLGA